MMSFTMTKSFVNFFIVALSLVLQIRSLFAEDIYPLAQPQIYIENGNIHFIPAEHKNVILKTNGEGKILFNSVELNNLIDSVQNSSRDLRAFKSIFGSPSPSSGQISTRISSIEETLQRLSQIDSLENRIIVLEQRIGALNESNSGGGSRIGSRVRRLKNRIDAIENQIRGVGTPSHNPCYSNPCSNGGTCIPTLYGAFCFCAKGWEGDRCNQDVNECANIAGTELACQNGATCVNQPGYFQCQCRSGYFGVSCSERSGGCAGASSYERCGHGICVDQHAGPNPYTCICDAGWTHDGRSPVCMVDVDECSQYHTSCSTNPPVSCINTPGSYVCGPCPPGYTGNGHRCTDINECLTNNGGCSVNPMVQCTNTLGSRTCGSCPPGFMGNGITCQYVGMCQMNNGGCHPLARCVDNPMIGQSFVQCVCPAGYTGTGMGLHGCIQYQIPGGGGTVVGPTLPPGGNPCVPNPCQNGAACHSYGGTFTCSCTPGFVGQTCSIRANPCLSQPCQNNGTCHQTATGFSCLCTNQFTGDLCERQVESCGGFLSSEEGVLKYPQTQSAYDDHAFCEWLLSTTSGKVFNLTFTNFHLEGGSRCGFDYLEIHDGADTQSPLLGRFCGDELPRGGNIVSTHNFLHMIFRSDHSVVGLGFEFSWNTTEPICGGVIENKAHGSFMSPGYPGNYPHNRDCTWQIKASLGKRVQIVFASFHLETHDNCSFDYLEIRDGLEDTAPVLEKLCNSTDPVPVISSGPYLSIRFHSDDSSSAQGFLITFTEMPGMPGCGGLLTDATAVFSSPQHPLPYPHGLECDWLIRLPTGEERIRLSFLTFELESSYDGCRYDFVEIRNGPSVDSPLVGRFCGRNLPPVYTSGSNQLFVRFKSDTSIELGGFSAKYEVVCGGEFSSLDGILRSPYYPNNYPKLRDCVYVISLPAGKVISLQFLDFDVEASGSDTNCYFDFLEIRDGDNANASLIGHYCGPPEVAPELITSSFNYLWLRFKTDGSIQNRGFLANYSSIDLGCGGILKESNGIITSPGHPEVYPDGVGCTWIIKGEPGEIVRLTWDTFNLESSSNCIYDKVEVYDNSTVFPNGSIFVGKYCGQEPPPMITSTDSTLTIIFKSDHSNAHDGFMATYKLLNATTACGGNFFSEYGVLKSPRYPDNYPRSKSCVWVITAPRGRQIELNVTDFDLEPGSSTCRYDYLEIRNGPHSTSPLIGKFCGNHPPPQRIPSFSNSLYLKFRSDRSHQRKGFKIEWDATSTGCGGVLNSPSGSISSPNYPTSYSNTMECTWKIFVNQGSAVRLSFVDIDLLHGSSTCWGERIEILDGVERNSPSLGKFCSEDHVISLESQSNSVTIRFISIFGSSGRGFQLNYQSICNRVIKGFQGVIESPNYPKPYPHHRNCTWILEANRGNKINISFSHFDVEGPYRGNCSYDFVQISQWKRTNPENKTIVGTYCGNDRPGLISSSTDTVAISFVSDYSHALNGFRLEWKQYGCGGRIIGDFGILKTPGYPRRYPRNVECIWKVTTEVGTKVQLTMYELDIEHDPHCQYDGLEIYGGPDETSPLLSKVCDTVTSHTTIASHGNNMYIRFYSDSSISTKGFYGYINQVPGGCGGTYRGTSGYIYSPNYPANYDHNDDCTWTISVDNNHVVELTFEDFDVERHINCTYDHVAVYDGYSDQAPLLLMHCGNQLPDPLVVRSTGNYMTVRLKTDASASGKGFKAKYSRGCGARLDGRRSGVITTPNFPGVIGYENINCSWIISGSSPDDRVTLTFTYMDLKTSEDEDCSNSFVEALDGEDYSAPSIYKACNGPAPPAITSQGNSMLLHIIGQHFVGHGFRAVYDLSSSACGGELTSANGSITSPNYPTGYPPNVECIWVIKASPGNQVQLTFRRFEVVSSDFCNSDFVEIHERSSSGPLLLHHCGNTIPSNVTAAEQIWILLRTDDQGQAPGFWADWNLVHGMELNGSSGLIASPMFPHSYSGTGAFTWRVTVNESYAVQLSFVQYEFESEDNEDCQYYDTITIYDGFDEGSPILLQTCEWQKPEPVITSGNVVYIEYNRKSWYKSFFLLRWKQIQSSFGGINYQTNITGCGGNFSIESGNATTLLSPGFPLSYPPNLNCVWDFDAPPGSRIRVKVESMALEGYSHCMNDRVELYDGLRGLPNYELNKTLCSFAARNSSYLSSGRFLRIVFKTDQFSWNTGFNLTLTTECGGYIRTSRGTISSANYPRNYVASNCIWYVIVRPGRTIRVSFNSEFEIYSGGDQCGTDQLILRNGGSEESPFLGRGRYCGSNAPAPLETSGNHLFVHFRSWTHGGKGFALTFEEVSLGCGGNIQLSDNAPFTSIMSPNFPQIPPPYTECEWVFVAPQGEAIQITFVQSFQLAYSPGCQSAGVEVRDGGTAISNPLGVFCLDMPGTLKSTGNVLYVRYYSSVAEPRNGFKGDVRIATCGGVHTGRIGTISSPGFPDTYQTNLDCLWTIKVPVGSYIVLEFQNFNLGSSDSNCTKDKVNITEQSAPDIINPRNWTFCGDSDSQLPNRIQSSSNEIQIRFVSDGQRESQLTGIGFKLRYRARTQHCIGTLRTPTGFIQSPGYPRPYPHYLYCVWKIYAQPGRRIRIEFSDFDLEERLSLNNRRGCYADKLWIYQGVLRSIPPLYNQSLCGSEIPQPVETSSSEAIIYFTTDGSIAHRGFKLSYSTDLPALCGGTLERDGGNVSSPNATTNTPNTTTNILCEWKTDSGQRGHGNGTTIVNLQRLQVPSWGVRDPLCSHGFLKVSPADSSIRYKWRKLCGSLTNERIYIPGNSLQVEYITGDANSSFSLTYRNVPCGGVLRGPEENVTSLNYPSPYPINTECIWMVEFPRGSQVKVKFLDMDLEDHRDTDGCDKDYIIIRNGKYPSSPMLGGRFCGTFLPNDMISMSNDLWIEFHSDGSADGSRRGFQIGLEQVTKGCGGMIHRKYGQLMSPQIDASSRKYPHNTECEWIIESVPGYMINVVFFDRFDIENSTNCTTDFVQIFQKNNLDWIPVGKFCGRQLPPPINTTSTLIKVVFRTNENLNGDGFRLYWYSPCGGIYTEPSGIIRSAHYDTFNHSQHVNPGRFWSFMGWESLFSLHKCDYVIQGNPEDYIVVQFTDPFEIQVPINYAVSETDLNIQCPRVNVSIWQGNFTGYLDRSPTCGRNVPAPFVGRGKVTLSYNYQPIFENFGFRAQYSKYDCGGDIEEPRTIISPGSPFTYAASMNCSWVVKAPEGKVVRFRFNFLELEQHGNCVWDSVRIYDGASIDNNKLIGTYCGNLTDESMATIKSKTNRMTVLFVSDSVVQYGGFQGAVDFTVGEEHGCGGLKNLTEGPVTITSIDLDRNGKYDDDLDCQWLLTAAEFMSIEISFNTFSLEDSQGQNKNSSGSCLLDFLEVRDGPGPFGEVLARLCGSSLPPSISSSLSHVWIRFVTDSSISFAGFSFTARSRPSPCGPLLLIANSTVQYLQSPNYPSNYDNNVRCTWQIDAVKAHEELDVTFIDLDIEAATDCSKDRLEISDVANSYTSPEGITGPTLFYGSFRMDWRFRHLNLSMESILQKALYCGSQTPPDFFSVGKSAKLIFHTDGSTAKKGFKIAYKTAGCNRTYTNRQGRIFSPEWPTHTPIFQNCLSSIQASNGTFISLYFNSFSLPTASGQTSCSESGFEVRDRRPSGPVLAQYCGTSIPNPVFSNSNVLFIKFFSRMHPARGYDITYTSTDQGRGCGGDIFHTGGSFTSPLYPGNYSVDNDCIWRVRVPGGLRIQIEFTNFMIGGSCQTDFVEISALDSHNPNASPVLYSRYCAGDVPSPYTGTMDMATVRYKTSTNNTGSGWRAIFKGVFPTNVRASSNSL